MRSAFFITCMMAVIASAAPAAAQPVVAPIEQRFTPEQLRATGLDGLSSEQLALLNRLLREERQEERREKQLAAPSRDDRGAHTAAAAPVSAQLPGEFRGWSKGTTFRLANGQAWRVTDGELYLGEPRQNVRLTVTPGFMGAWYLQAEGESPRAKVQRVE